MLTRARDIGIQRLVARYCWVDGLMMMPVATSAVKRSCTETIPNTFRMNLDKVGHIRVRRIPWKEIEYNARRTLDAAFVRSLLYQDTNQILRLYHLTFHFPTLGNIPLRSTLDLLLVDGKFNPLEDCRTIGLR